MGIPYSLIINTIIITDISIYNAYNVYTYKCITI